LCSPYRRLHDLNCFKNGSLAREKFAINSTRLARLQPGHPLHSAVVTTAQFFSHGFEPEIVRASTARKFIASIWIQKTPPPTVAPSSKLKCWVYAPCMRSG